jgi:uncharacterized protein
MAATCGLYPAMWPDAVGALLHYGRPDGISTSTLFALTRARTVGYNPLTVTAAGVRCGGSTLETEAYRPTFTMIVDCHTHVWESPEQLGKGVGLWDGRGRGRSVSLPRAGVSDHLLAAKPVDKSIVLALKSNYLKAEIPNNFVAGYVRQHADRLVGFAAVDPTRPREAIAELRRAHDQLGMKGVTVWPAAQDFHPSSTSAMRVFGEAARLRMPIVFHQDVQALPASKMEFARPYLLDDVAREFPELKIVITQIGYPWVEETLVLLSKHANVFAEIGGLLHHPWQAYHALISAHQLNVMDALLFGSNYPVNLPAVCIENLYSINQFSHGTNLPNIPREQLRQIVERDSLQLLGIESNSRPAPRAPDSLIRED